MFESDATADRAEARDRRWAFCLLNTGMSPEEAARLLERPLEFVVGVTLGGLSTPVSMAEADLLRAA